MKEQLLSSLGHDVCAQHFIVRTVNLWPASRPLQGCLWIFQCYIRGQALMLRLESWTLKATMRRDQARPQLVSLRPSDLLSKDIYSEAPVAAHGLAS